MFGIGEYVVYSSIGVCKVKDITVPAFCKEDEKRPYYALSPIGSSGEIMVPVDTTVFMRPILTREESDAMIDCIPSMEAEPYRARGLQELKAHYSKGLQSHDPKDLLMLMMSVSAKKEERRRQNQRIGVIDENCMKRARNFLYSELALSLGISDSEVEPYIISRIGSLPY